MSRSIVLLIILGFLLIILNVTAQVDNTTESIVNQKKIHEIAEKILNDTTFFSEAFAHKLYNFYNTMQQDQVGMRIPLEQQPKITEIIKKYGKPNKTEVKGYYETLTLKEATVYYYGVLWLFVPLDNSQEKVTWVELAGHVKLNTPKAFFIAEKILSNYSFFSKEFCKESQPKLDFAKSVEQGKLFVAVPVPEPQPMMENIINKYGNPDKIIEEKKSDRMPEYVVIYFYGRIGFGVPKDQTDTKVKWVIYK